MITSTTETNINYCGKHKIPRYIYHLTNKTNYEAILKDGLIKTSQPEFSGYSIFATDLTNLFKRWKNDIFNFNHSLIQGLINHSLKGEDNIVIIRIPTSGLNKNNLFIRSQNRLNKFTKNPLTEIGIMEAKNDALEFSSSPVGNKDFIEFCRKSLKDWLEHYKVSNVEHCIYGTPADRALHYKRKKEAIEYIYREDIPIDKIEKIGEVNIVNLKKSYEYDIKKPMRSIFTALLKDTPECKGAELLNC